MDPALIRRFEDQRIPRYTSYPTAPRTDRRLSSI
jgi:hypothetical protein